MHVEDHHVTIYTSSYGAWAACLCGWQSPNFRYRTAAQQSWAVHVARLIRDVSVEH